MSIREVYIKSKSLYEKSISNRKVYTTKSLYLTEKKSLYLIGKVYTKSLYLTKSLYEKSISNTKSL